MTGVYGGNTLLLGLSQATNIPLDHLNFVATQIIALALAPLMRTVLHPKVAKVEIRQTFVLVIGFCLGYFAFGDQTLHLATFPGLCYILLKTQNPKVIHRWVMVVALGYLSIIHIHRMIYDTGVYALDVSGPLMVMTQKITSLAFSLHDGMTKSEKDMKYNQKQYAVLKVPSLLEYFSYMLHFSTLMAGPVVFYNDYNDFITGNNFLISSPSNNNQNGLKKEFVEPRPLYPALKKIAVAVVCAAVFTLVTLPMDRVRDEDFLKRSVIYQLIYLYFSGIVFRLKYFHAWVLSDAINNLSGFGLNGFTPDGQQKWDLTTNIDIVGFELGQNLRECIQCWNLSTNIWLRMVAYERVPKRYSVLLTYTLSAVWHGFYPGYYVTFFNGALFTIALRSVRKYFRPLFLEPPERKVAYDFISIIFTRFMMIYIVFPFILLDFMSSFWVYWNMYFWMHALAISAILLLPKALGINQQSQNRLTKLVTDSNSVNGLQG